MSFINTKGFEVVVIDNLSSSRKEFLLLDQKLYVSDLRDSSEIEKIFIQEKPDVAIHLAALISVEDSVIDPLLYYDNNFLSTLNFLRACRVSAPKAVLFSSSACVYGNAGLKPAKETDATATLSPYGSCKLAEEKAIAEICLSLNIAHIIFRFFNVAGAHPSAPLGQVSVEATHLIKRLCQVGLGKISQVNIYGDDYPTSDGTCIRDYIHVADIANAYFCAVKNILSTHVESGIYNCGYGQGFSVRQVVEKFKQTCRSDISIATGKRRPGDAVSYVADNKKALNLLGWVPQYNDLGSILQSAYAWEKNLFQG